MFVYSRYLCYCVAFFYICLVSVCVPVFLSSTLFVCVSLCVFLCVCVCWWVFASFGDSVSVSVCVGACVFGADIVFFLYLSLCVSVFVSSFD